MIQEKTLIAFIDHYDSFSRNVIGWLEAANADRFEILHVYSDDNANMDRLRDLPVPLVLSPGPKAPRDNPLTLRLVEKALGQRPILGVCLGHQILAYVHGGAVERSAAARHGATRQIQVHHSRDLFSRMPTSFNAAAYNSLTVSQAVLNNAKVALLATCENDEVQALRFDAGAVPAFGVQFHPESFLSDSCNGMAAYWLGAAAAWRQPL